MTPELLTHYLARAQHEELGLAIETNNQNYLFQQLSDANEDPGLIITRPALEGWVFIVKRNVELYPDVGVR
jgi:hypothetical protein